MGGIPSVRHCSQPVHGVFEELALTTELEKPKLWKRYVDDTFCVAKRDEVKKLLDHLNRIRPTIKFTFELEKEGSLPF